MRRHAEDGGEPSVRIKKMQFNAKNGCKIVTCNVAGLTREKIPHYRQLFEDVDVLCLQETHGKRKEITKQCKA